MATGRILKKQISLSEAVNSLSLKAALLFTWAIPHADDFGRLAGSPKRVKAQVVPMRDDISVLDVAEILRELHLAGLIVWYELNGELYIQFPKFDEHQTGLHKRTASKLPAPPQGAECVLPEVPGISRNASTCLEPNGGPPSQNETAGHAAQGLQTVRGERIGEFPEIPGSHRNDSSVRLERGEGAQVHEEPQSLGTEGPQALGGETEGRFPENPGNSEPRVRARNRTEQELEPEPEQEQETESLSSRTKRGKGGDYTPDFEEFWSLYPRRLGKKAAFAKWKAQLRKGVSAAELLAAAKHYAIVCQGREERFIMQPETFLGPQDRFQDYLGPPSQAQAGPRQSRAFAGLQAEYEREMRKEDSS